ncbi:hypothetical protein [Mycoplasma sp. 5370]
MLIPAQIIDLINKNGPDLPPIYIKKVLNDYKFYQYKDEIEFWEWNSLKRDLSDYLSHMILKADYNREKVASFFSTSSDNIGWFSESVIPGDPIWDKTKIFSGILSGVFEGISQIIEASNFIDERTREKVYEISFLISTNGDLDKIKNDLSDLLNIIDSLPFYHRTGPNGPIMYNKIKNMINSINSIKETAIKRYINKINGTERKFIE